MSGYRKKPKTVANIEAFGDDMSAIFKTLNRYQMDLYTGGEHYLALVDLHSNFARRRSPSRAKANFLGFREQEDIDNSTCSGRVGVFQ